ncbi:hypothetical protein C8J56DRAFT_1040821 [Mycena floridula]|nr:hypothetical protein C8J56DRAFT_1040821 [Mycena floridula]
MAISQPSINRYGSLVLPLNALGWQLHRFSGTATFPGQAPIDTGRMLLSETRDLFDRPVWAKDGSQLVPGFNAFLEATVSQSLTADLLGARMIGRWKTSSLQGAPVDLSPLADDPELGNDPREITISIIIILTWTPRWTISDIEAAGNVSDNSVELGLTFVAYQASIGVGLTTLQRTWANILGSPPDKKIVAGTDPIIGENLDNVCNYTGLDTNNPTEIIMRPMHGFVISRRGQYFFSPPISALLTPLGA